MTSSRLDEVIDPGSCALEQQDMHALYHVTLNDEVYDVSMSGCVMIDISEKDEELKLLKTYLDVGPTKHCLLNEILCLHFYSYLQLSHREYQGD